MWRLGSGQLLRGRRVGHAIIHARNGGLVQAALVLGRCWLLGIGRAVGAGHPVLRGGAVARVHALHGVVVAIWVGIVVLLVPLVVLLLLQSRCFGLGHILSAGHRPAAAGLG